MTGRQYFVGRANIKGGSSMKRFRRFISIAAAGVMMVGLLGGCGSGKKNDAGKNGEINVLSIQTH